MFKTGYQFISDAMLKAGAPAYETVASNELPSKGFFLEENYLPPAEIPAFVGPFPSVGMVVSQPSVDWNWKEAGRDYHAVFHPENICTSPGGPFPQQWWTEPIRILTVSFEQQFLSQSWQGIDATRTVEMRLSPTGVDPVVSHLCWALHSELRSGWPTGPIVVEALAAALAAALSQRFSVNAVSTHKLRGGLSQRALKVVIEYIRQNVREHLGLKELSGLACLSQFHFCRQFKVSTGQSVHEYVTSVRIEVAKRLLSSTDLPISEVAHQSGLPNLSHFTTVFNKSVGVTPRGYRLQTGSHRLNTRALAKSFE